MHGRKRASLREQLSADAREEKAKKLAIYKKAIRVALQHCATNDREGKAWEVNSRMIAMNPDDYELWNHRRPWYLDIWNSSPRSRAPLLGGELKLTQMALKRQPKSYLAWLHRRRIIALALDTDVETKAAEAAAATDGTAAPDSAAATDGADAPDSAAASADRPDAPTAPTEPAAPLCDLAAELALCATFLELDQRNFHCHNYRRWLLARSGAPAEDDAAFCEALIARSPSNYSAWHQRSQALSRLAATPGSPAAAAGGGGALSMATVSSELELVRGAIYTEPDDSSPWFYHRWLLARLAAALGVAGSPVPSMLAAAAPGRGHCPADDGEPRLAGWQGVRAAPNAATGSSAEEGEAEEAVRLLRVELAACRELRSLEEEAAGGAAPASLGTAGLGPGKWPSLAEATVLQLLRAAGKADASDVAAEGEAFDRLIAVDPRHAAFYRYARRQGSSALARGLLRGGGGALASPTA